MAWGQGVFTQLCQETSGISYAGQEEENTGLDQQMAPQQAPQGGPKGIPTATVAGGMQQQGAGSTAREQALHPERPKQQPASAMDADEGDEREGTQEQAAEVGISDLSHSFRLLLSPSAIDFDRSIAVYAVA